MSPGPIWSQLLLQGVLIAVNAFFAATEIAIISLNENKVRHQAEEGDAKAKAMLKLVEKPEGFLSTIQIGITLAGFLGSAFAADNFASRLVDYLVNTCGVTAIPESTLNTIAVVLITVILSYFTLVLGELVPKRFAMQKSEALARAVVGFMSGSAKALSPFIWLLSKSTNGVLRLLRVDPNAAESDVTEEEIRMMVDIGEEKGAIESSEREMIENIFDFNNKAAEECMTHRTNITAIWVEDTPEEIVKTIEETGLSRFPVYDEDLDDIIGTLTTRDWLLNSRRENPKPLRDLVRPAYFVPESVRTDALFRDMQAHKVHMAIVVDEYGGTSGLITMEDLLEEIVGNIYDEFDPQAAQDITALTDDTWRVSGSVDIETLNDALELSLPVEEDYDTLGGLIFSQFTTIPKDGTHPIMTVENLEIRVEEITDRRVEWAVVRKLSPVVEENPEKEEE